MHIFQFTSYMQYDSEVAPESQICGSFQHSCHHTGGAHKSVTHHYGNKLFIWLFFRQINVGKCTHCFWAQNQDPFSRVHEPRDTDVVPDEGCWSRNRRGCKRPKIKFGHILALVKIIKISSKPKKSLVLINWFFKSHDVSRPWDIDLHLFTFPNMVTLDPVVSTVT